MPLGIAEFDPDVPALDITEVMQSLEEGLQRVGAGGSVARQDANSNRPGRLLRLGGKRCGKNCPDGDQEVPALNAVHVSLLQQVAGVYAGSATVDRATSNGRYR